MLRSGLHAFLITLLFVFSSQKVMSQEWNTARLSVLYGSSVPFNFNTLEKIKNGVELTTGTRLGITLASAGILGHDLQGFVLNCRAFNYQSLLGGDVHTLPLNKIRIKVENTLGLESGISYGYKDLTSDWVPLFSFTSQP